MTGELVNIRKASEITGISKEQLRAGCKKGEIPHIRVGQGTNARYKIYISKYIDMLNEKSTDPLKKENEYIEEKDLGEKTKKRQNEKITLRKTLIELKMAQEKYNDALNTILILNTDIKNLKDELAKQDLEIAELQRGGNKTDDLKKARENYSQALDTITSLSNELKGVKDELAKKDLEVQGLRKIQQHNNGTFEQAVQILRLTNNLLDAIVASMAEGKL